MMAFEKYIKRNGKVYGPYIYQNKKEGGKVITTYLGKSKPKKNYNRTVFAGVFFLLLFLGLFFVMNFSFTGKVTLSLEESYEFGEQITGRVKLNLVQGELLPSSTKVLIDNAGEINKFLLSDLISSDISEGDFYVENLEISGEGEGYGVLGEKIIYPNVSFVLNILPKGLVIKPEKPEGSDKIIDEPELEVEPEIIPENKTEIINESIEEPEVTEPEDEETSEPEIEKEEIIEPEPEQEESEPEVSPLTGAVISELISEVEGVVSKNNPFSYNLPNGKTAEIKESSQNVELSIVDSVAVVTTEYFEVEEGFGKDYLTEEIFEFSIDLSKLNLTAQREGNFVISLMYSGSEIISVSKEISIEGELEVPVVGQNLTEENITIQNETLVNESIISIIEGEMNLTTIQYGAVLNKPVKWKKNIKLTQPLDNLSIEIPVQAENVNVFVISSLEKQDVEEEIVNETVVINESVEVINESVEEVSLWDDSGESNETFEINESELRTLITAEIVLEFDDEKFSLSNFFKKVFGTFTGRVIEAEDEMETKKVFIEEDATEFEIEYETPAPYAIEANISNGKRIIIASDVHYENILAYTAVEDSVKINSDDLKLYWYASYEDALDYNASLAQDAVENVTINESEEQNITVEINESVDENAISENESYFSVLTGNVIANETLENISEQNESVVVVNESVNETLIEINETNTLTNTKDTLTDIRENTLTDIREKQVGARRWVGADPRQVGADPISVIENISEKIKIQVPYVGYDLDEDGYVDYIEWLVPHLSNQTYELVIEITKAEHLDENRSFISDIYDDVKALDGNWSEVINDSEYVRVTFEQKLDNTRDITVYARSVCAVSGDGYVVINGTQVSCGIYQKKKRIEEIRRLLDE